MLKSVTLTIGSASYTTDGNAKAPFIVKLTNKTLLLQATGLNIIELLSINMGAGTQAINEAISVVGVDSNNNTLTFFNGTVSYQVTIKNGTMKGAGIVQH